MRLVVRKIVSLCGVAALGVLLVGLFFWEDFAVAYYVDRMESDPQFLNEVVGESESGVRGEALRRFLKSANAVPLLLDSLLAQRWDPFDDEEAPPVAHPLLLLKERAVPVLRDFLEESDLNVNRGQDKVLKVLERIGPDARSAISGGCPMSYAHSLGVAGNGSDHAGRNWPRICGCGRSSASRPGGLRPQGHRAKGSAEARRQAAAGLTSTVERRLLRSCA